MKGPKPKYKIQLLENEITELHKVVRSHNSPHVKVMRARIVLDAHEHPEWSNQQISAHAARGHICNLKNTNKKYDKYMIFIT